MKKVGPEKLVTRKMLDQAVDAILKGMDNIVGEMTLRFKSVDARFDKVEDRLDNLKSGQMLLKDDIRGLKAELSGTPSRREFEDLKSRVDKYHSEPRSL